MRGQAVNCYWGLMCFRRVVAMRAWRATWGAASVLAAITTGNASRGEEDHRDEKPMTHG